MRCFITVAREGTVSRAATLLHLTQPAVSLQLKGLEESTGLQLFNRTPGGFTLTEAGAALLPLAHRTVSASADFRTAADSLRESQRATLRVGTILDPESIRLGPFVRSLATSSKKTEVFLRYGMSDDVLAQIGRGELDVGYYIDATPPECLASGILPERTIDDGKFRLTALMRYDYRVIAPREWSDKVLGKDWADLIDLPWITTPHASAHRRLIDDVFRPTGSLPKRVAFAEHEDAMIEFVEAGNCLSLVRDCVLDRITRNRNFVIADKVALTCDLSFACLTSRRHEPIDLAGLLGHAGGMGSETRAARRLRRSKRRDRGKAPGDSLIGSDFGRIRLFAGSGLPSQIDFSDRHSSDVSSGGPLAARSSRLIRASRSSLRGWVEMMESPLLSLPVTRSSNSPVGFAGRPSRCMTSMAKPSALVSASRECDDVTSVREPKISALEPVMSPNSSPIRNDVLPSRISPRMLSRCLRWPSSWASTPAISSALSAFASNPSNR